MTKDVITRNYRAQGGKGAFLPNLQPLIQAGIDPISGWPKKMTSGCDLTVVDNVKMALRVIDEQDAVNRFKWENLPCDITSQELERMLYYRGQLAFFYDKNTDKFYFMPYTLDGTIDFYGRYNTIHPIPFAAGMDKNGKVSASLQNYLNNIKLDVLYTMPEDPSKIDPTKVCVLLKDYTNQLAQTLIPRQQLNDVFAQQMAECMGYANTNLILSTGVHGVKVGSADEADRVYEASRQLKSCALTGNPYLPIEGTGIDMQELGVNKMATVEEYYLAMKSIDNVRLSTYGIDNGGLYEKKAQELESEAAVNGGPVNLVMEDGLSNRENAKELMNFIIKLIRPEAKEVSVNKNETLSEQNQAVVDGTNKKAEEAEGDSNDDSQDE